jgi:hypothetical protein
MTTTFLDLVVVLVCPLILTAGAWFIFSKVVAGTDEISDVVEALTRANGVQENIKRRERLPSSARFQRDRDGERPSDEKGRFSRR